MNIPHVRIVVPLVVIAVALTAYAITPHPFTQDTSTATQAIVQDYRTRANEYMEKKEYKEALDLLLKLEELAPEDLAAHYAVARLYQAANMKAEARAALERGIPHLNDPEANSAYAKMLSELQ